MQEGSQVGVLSIYVQDQLSKQVPLLAAEDVARGNWFQVMWDTVKRFLQDLIRKR